MYYIGVVCPFAIVPIGAVCPFAIVSYSAAKSCVCVELTLLLFHVPTHIVSQIDPPYAGLNSTHHVKESIICPLCRDADLLKKYHTQFALCKMIHGVVLHTIILKR